jgi:hypothetical protein
MDKATTTAEPTDEQIRMRFERSVLNSQQLAGNTPLGTVTVNGQFGYYMDADTDTLWIGYRAGFRAALKADA